MGQLTLQILDGADRGRLLRDLATPVTIGREEGNALQLNDERVSRYHVKIQEDQGQLVLTDLDSTNGTRVNGEMVQLSIVRLGDRISVGRTLLLVGSPEEIDQRFLKESADAKTPPTKEPADLASDHPCPVDAGTEDQLSDKPSSSELRFQLNVEGQEAESTVGLPQGDPGPKSLKPPCIPDRLSPAQSAQLSELLLYLHRCMARATEDGVVEDGRTVRISEAAWHAILQVEMHLARYVYGIGHPDEEE